MTWCFADAAPAVAGAAAARAVTASAATPQRILPRVVFIGRRPPCRVYVMSLGIGSVLRGAEAIWTDGLLVPARRPAGAAPAGPRDVDAVAVRRAPARPAPA